MGVEEHLPAGRAFNSTLETGIRSVVLLEAFYPRRWGLLEMTWLDHLVVHTGDLDGDNVPPSLHPALPNRAGELLVRRRLVEESLRAMQRVHLVDVEDSEGGIVYCASEEVPSFLGALRSEYTMALKERAGFLARRFASLSTEEIKATIEARIGRWTAEFGDGDATGASPR